MADEVEQQFIEDALGQEPKKGALRRGWKLLPRMVPYLRPYKKFAVISVVLTVLAAVFLLAEPWPIAFVIDSIIGDKPFPDWLPTIFGTGVAGLILLAVFATLLFTLLNGGLTVLNEYLSTTIDQRMVLDLRSEMFEHAQKLSLAFHDNERKGVLMYRINNQAASLGQVITALPVLGQSFLTVVGMAVVTITINPLLAALAMGITPFIAYSTTFYADRIEPRIYYVRGLGALNLAIVYEAMAMMRVVMAFGHERREYKRFRKQGEKWANATIDLTVRQTAFQLVVQFITAVGTAAVLGVGAYQAVKGQISAGELIVVLTYIAKVYQPLEELTHTLTNFQQWFINLRMAFDLLDKEPSVKEKEDAVDLGRARGEIELDGVGFSYATRAEVLDDVSFKVPAGDSIAVVGPTGAGKSTLASLLPRFFDAAEGRVLIDGVDVRDAKLKSLRSQFSIVLQEPLLFSGTISENILYGNPKASHEEVEAAAKAANAHDFIMELPDGYETMVGEHGTKVSGGERQRISVARAFLRDAPILILDEPTSSIDSRTESVILEALERLMAGRTTIVIAHRLSTIRAVDRVIVMDEGRIAQTGTHEELVEQGGLYGELWEAQTRVYRRVAPVAPSPPPLSLPAPAPQPASVALERSRPKIVLLGMLSKIPVGGPAWLVGHYAVGFERLGYDVYYVEAHARTPSMLMTHENDDGIAKAAEFIVGVMRRFGLEDKWAIQAPPEDGRCLGMSTAQLDRLYADAALILNMHGGTLPLPEHAATDRLVFLGTDPVEVELEIDRSDQSALEFLRQHVAYFTWGLNHGNPDCGLPWSGEFPLVPSPPPVVLDFWESEAPAGVAPFTTIGNWRQQHREVHHDGRVYHWSKHQEFMKILRLPQLATVPIELALSTYDDEDQLLLAEHGWRVRSGLALSRDLDSYRDYIRRSAGELSAAKEQNVHFRSGWFSERSATYLAAGRPVVLQDTGFGNALPTGEGLFAFGGVSEAADALEEIRRDPARHRRAAREIAREYLAHDVVLGDLLEHVGLTAPAHPRGAAHSPARAEPPATLDLQPRSRRPLELSAATVEAVTTRAVPAVAPAAGGPEATIVMPVLDNLACTRMALESVLASTGNIAYEVVVVDNGSGDETRQYLEVLASRNRNVRVIRNDHNRGFAAACNQGLAAASADLLVLLNNDAMVPPGWLRGLYAHAADERVGLVGPVTNRIGNEAEVRVDYRTWEGFLSAARERSQRHAGERSPLPTPAMFCLAMRRDVYEAVGPLDERFEVGMLEDDDYALRVSEAGLENVCAEDVLVHHFGEASFGSLVPTGERDQILANNKQRFEEKWGFAWTPYGRRRDAQYEDLLGRLREFVEQQVPSGATVLVVSRGDEELLRLNGCQALHFPQGEAGRWMGNHPADSDEAISELERMRQRGADYLIVPATSHWWLDHYDDFRRHLDRYHRATQDPDTATIYKLEERVEAPALRDPA